MRYAVSVLIESRGYCPCELNPWSSLGMRRYRTIAISASTVTPNTSLERTRGR